IIRVSMNDRIKEILQSNKIYMDVFSTLILGVMGLFVTFASYVVSESQLQESKIANYPHFHIEGQLIKDTQENVYNDHEMLVFNTGAPAYNIDINSYEFLEVEMRGSVDKTAIIPINGYYLGRINTQSPKGLVSKFIGPNNNGTLFELSSDLLDYSNSNDIYMQVSLKELVVISYVQRDGDENTQYFLDGKLMTYDKVELLLEINSVKSLIQFRELTPSKLENLLSSQENA
ncbi:TPA: hypothetical protein ACQYC5_004477, partial [Vibrio parahaemolyticus]